MDDAMKRRQAVDMYNTFCQMLDAEGWKYTKDEEKLAVDCKARGEDLPMDMKIKIHEEFQLIQIFSHLPFQIPKDKRLDTAVVVSVINNKLVHGCFDYDVLGGDIFFRMSSCFAGSLLSREACKYLLMCSCATIDNYNDKLLMVGKGMIELEQFLKSEL